MKYNFKDLVNVTKLQELTDELYNAASIPSAIISIDGEVLTGSGWQRICMNFHRQHPQIEKECIESDTKIRKQLDRGEPYAIYKCPRGLVDASSPVIIAGEHVVNVFAGQIFLEPPDETTEQYFREQAKKFGFDESEYIKAFKEIPVFTKEEFRAVLKFLSILAQVIAKMGLTRLSELESTEKLRKSEERYRELVEGTDNLITKVDQYGNFTYVNYVGEILFGVAANTLVGMSAFEFMHPEDRKKTQSWLDESVGKKLFKSTIENRYVNQKTGEVSHLLWTIHFVYDDKNQIKEVNGIAHNITERKKIEKALRKSERNLNRAQRITKTASWYYNWGSETEEWSDECFKIFGLNKDDFPDNVVPESLSSNFYANPEDLEQLNIAAEENHDVYNYELKFTTVPINGHVKIIHSHCEVERDNDGNILKVFGTDHDITEQEQAKEQIKASLKEKQILLDEIHHRVKNNMAVIISLLKLQSNKLEDNRMREILIESQSRVYAMSAVHETLHGSENLSEIDIKTYLSNITTSIFQTYNTNQGNVKLNSDIENLPININQAYPLGLVINELISNSLKYAFPDEKKGEIAVSMKKLEKEIELTISDNGIGISEELIWKDSDTLGLKLVQTLVENQLDGLIDLDRTNGTKFTIKFDIKT